jgi:cell division protein FtsB
MRRAAWLLLVSVTAVGILVLFVFPGRTLLAQDRNIAAAHQAIRTLDRENVILRQRDAALHDPIQIEHAAQQRFGLVLPGQRAYAITAPPVVHRARKAAAKPVHHHGSWWQSLELWHS